jgi:hypothetical protein
MEQWKRSRTTTHEMDFLAAKLMKPARSLLTTINLEIQ